MLLFAIVALGLIPGTMLTTQVVGANHSQRFDFSNYKYYGTWFYSDAQGQPAADLRVMVSNDGLRWTDIRSSYVTNNPTGRVGNASLLWANNRFNLYTCGGTAQTIQTAYSTDGHVYTNYRNPPFNAHGRGDFAADESETWAGNWFVDRSGHIHIVWSSSGGILYDIQARNDKDLSEGFGDPVRLKGSALSHGIDPFIYDDGTDYYLFYQPFKNGTADDNYISVLKSSNPFNGYDTQLKHGNWTGLGNRSDQPIIYPPTVLGAWTIYDDDWGEAGERRVRLKSGDWRLGTDKWGEVERLTPSSPKIRAGTFILVPN